MRSLCVLALAAAVAPAADLGLKPGTPKVQSISALAFGPGGVLFVGDPVGASVIAVATNDTAPAGKGDVMIEKIDDKVGSAVGTAAANVTINDVKVNPASGNVYLAVTRGKGKDASPVILKLDRAGKMSELSLENVPFAQVSLPGASDKSRQQAITSMAYVAGQVVVAGLSNEEFASTLRAIPFPFQEAAKPTGIEIFHGAHGKFETNAPIMTFTPYTIAGADYLMAAYTCTPLVKVPVSDLKPGAKVKGTTIAELGNRNRPLDIVAYKKDGKDYLLMANSARGVMKIAADGAADAPAITKRVGEKTGLQYDTIAELKGVQQLDKLDDSRALLLVKGDDNGLSLKTIPLP